MLAKAVKRPTRARRKAAPASVPRARSVTPVRHHMARAPLSIEPERSLADAHALMRRYRIRHLPVVSEGRLVGIVSQRDLMLIETLPDVNPAEVPVEDAMTREVFQVEPSAPLGKVAAEMADRKLGSVVVMEEGRVVGVFTVTDACRALALMMGQNGARTGRARVRRSAPAPTRRS